MRPKLVRHGRDLGGGGNGKGCPRHPVEVEISVVDRGWSRKHTESPSSVPKDLNSGSVGLGNFQTLREWSLLPVTMRGRLGHLSWMM